MKKGDCVYCPAFIRLGYPECSFGIIIETYDIGIDYEFQTCRVLWSDGSIGLVLTEFLIKADK